MIKLFSLKQQKKEEESAGGNRTGAGGKKASAAQLRIQKGKEETQTGPEPGRVDLCSPRRSGEFDGSRGVTRARRHFIGWLVVVGDGQLVASASLELAASCLKTTRQKRVNLVGPARLMGS